MSVSIEIQDYPFTPQPVFTGELLAGTSIKLHFASTHVFALDITPDKGFEAIINGSHYDIPGDNDSMSLVLFRDSNSFSSITIDATHANMSYGVGVPTPEPSTCLMLAFGLLAMFIVGRKRYVVARALAREEKANSYEAEFARSLAFQDAASE